ncbi:TPA: N-acetyltransferase [Serratia marcescens]|jgi:acetyltransferase-like isoleucine patch superfamily enzyme|uniref:acyltransferase n=1 Tax=Serratia TaxID=613 RepID=UPI00066847FD|nr:acyltransferase [Serratia marcescens]MBM1295521.1 N-acetyltransferase [Serratia nematodiphila]MBH2667076.1 N-acetyltransferase [Serratia marcescens]MBH2672520.1 N-acetyltransferase [Serratia marcescens]MBH3056477.1 N-acetyltransferase [Serratia marcescens]MBH3202495.1 N-acetyltransferase [Serratia marcescens]
MSSVITTRQAGIVDVEAGRNVTVIEPCNLYGCRLGDDVFVGPFVEIQRHVSIGARSKIQSHSFICEYVTLGEACFVGHGVTFANDLFKDGAPNADPASWGRTCIGDRVSIGSGATILAVEICSDTVIGAGAVVTRDITRKGIYAGNPARLLRELP